ncbi:MAG: sugar phosphate isomerase/epimerase family protein [Ruminococcus sp.]|jgi:hypothetical protein
MRFEEFNLEKFQRFCEKANDRAKEFYTGKFLPVCQWTLGDVYGKYCRDRTVSLELQLDGITKTMETENDWIPYLHIKECNLQVKEQMDQEKWSFAKAVEEGVMCEPGSGDIDFAGLFREMENAGYDGWAVVEQDMYPVNNFDLPFQIAKRTREYLRKAGV